MPRRRTTFLSFLVFTTLFFSACQSASTPTPAEPLPTEIPALQTPAAAAETTAAPPAAETSAATEELRRTVGDQTAILAFNQEFDMLNPLYAQNLSSQIVYGIWNCSAWDFDDQENALPVLVKQIPTVKDGGVSADGREITFRLRDDIAWSDGEPITSKDFQFTYQMITDPQNNVLNLTPYDLIEEVSAPDPQTVVVRFKEPNNAWLYSLWKVLLPAHILEPEFSAQGSIQEAAWNFTPGVGCGPFVFESEVDGESVTFKTNENYWRDYPLIGKILVKFFPDDASKAQAIIAGQADLSIFLVDSTTQVPIMKAANMQILAVNSGYREGFFYFLDPTNGHPALQDVRVRQAIAMAVDREAIIQNSIRRRPQDRDFLLGRDPVHRPRPQAVGLRSGKGEKPAGRSRLGGQQCKRQPGQRRCRIDPDLWDHDF